MVCEQIGRAIPSENFEKYFDVKNKEELKKLDFKEEFDIVKSQYPKETLLKRFYTQQELKDDIASKVA